MNTNRLPRAGSLLGLSALGLMSCGVQARTENEPVGSTAQALLGGEQTGVNTSLVAFYDGAGTALCAGTAVAADLVATTAACAARIPATFGVGKLTSPSDTAFTQVSGLSRGSAVIAGDELVAYVLLPASVGALPKVEKLDPGTAIPATVNVSAISTDDASRKPVIRRSITTAAPTPPPDPDIDGLHCLRGAYYTDGIDDGIPVIDGPSGKLVGIGSTAPAPGCTGAIGLIPAKRLLFGPDSSFLTGAGAATTRYHWVLGGRTPVFELQMLFPGFAQMFKTDTGIPKRLPSLYAADDGIPKVFTNEDLFLPHTPDTTGADGQDGYRDVRVRIGGEDRDPTTMALATAADGTTDTDYGTVLTPRADLGMSFVMSAKDAVTFNTTGDAIQSVNTSWKGFPSADNFDGKFLTIGGESFSTPIVPSFRGYANCRTDQPLKVQVFDADVSGSWDSAGSGGTKTCVRLVVDQNMDGPVNDPPFSTDTVTDCVVSWKDSTSLVDNEWTDLVPTGVHPNCANATISKEHRCDVAENGTDVQRSCYRLEVYLADSAWDCSKPQADQPPATAMNAFKIRSMCDVVVQSAVDTFNILAFDNAANVFDPSMGYSAVVPTKSTTYERNGTVSYVLDTTDYMNVSGTPTITLKNLDADDCDIACLAGGQSRSTHLLPMTVAGVPPFKKLNSSWQFDPTLYTTPLLSASLPATSTSGFLYLLRHQDPSGIFDKTPDANEAGKFQVTINYPALAVVWRNVRVANNITQVPVSRSPTVHPVLSNNSEWHPTVSTLNAAQWSANTPALTALLPLAIGDPGGRRTATTVAQAQALLAGNDLTALLAAATLNLKRAQAQNLPLADAVIRSTTVTVSEAIRQANQVLAGTITQPPLLERLLQSINAGLVLFNYGAVDRTAGADDDIDGIPNITDNCPGVPNPAQEDIHIPGDGVGDLCDPQPLVDCVLQRGTGLYTAYFGYRNLSETAMRVVPGDLNRFLTGSVDRKQPTLFETGEHPSVFSVDFNGTPLSWSLAGNVATASSSSPACTGAQGTAVRIDPRTVLLASNRLELGDRVALVNLDAVAAGSGGLVIGHDSRVGNAYTEGICDLQDRAHVLGDARANGAIRRGHDVEIAGLQITPATVDVDDIGLSSSTPGGAVPPPPLPHDGTLTLTPGNYTELWGGDRATLILQTGTYYFDKLRISNDAHLVVDDSAGLVRVILRKDFQYADRASTSSQSGSPPKLLVQYVGGQRYGEAQDISLYSSFNGSIVAPWARLNLGRSGSSYEGTFFARNVTVTHEARVKYVPFVAN